MPRVHLPALLAPTNQGRGPGLGWGHAEDQRKSVAQTEPKLFKARADFSQDFFSVGGFESVYSDGSETLEEAAANAIESNCGAVVLCSTDEKYEEFAVGLASLIKRAKPLTKIILAGYPKDKIEVYKAAGVDEFIHIKANVYEINKALQQDLGVWKIDD